MGRRLAADEVDVEPLESCDAPVGGMQWQIAEAIDQLEDGGGPQLALAENEPLPGPCVIVLVAAPANRVFDDQIVLDDLPQG